MEKTNQQHIRRENTRAIFSAITEVKEISRADIAAKTGLSLMTVGKVADLLDALGIVRQEKDERVSAGRKARLITYNPYLHLLVLDLTSVNFTLRVLDLSLSLIDEVVYPYDEGLFCEENLVLFLKNMSIYLKSIVDMEDCIGMGVLLPGGYDEKTDRILGSRLTEFSPMRPKTLLQGLLPVSRITLMEDSRASALASHHASPELQNQTCIWLSLDRPVSGMLTIDGKPLLGAHNCAGRFGEITVGSGFTLDQALLTLTDKSERAAAVAIALYSLIAVTDPASVLLESRTEPIDDEFLDMVRSRLAQMNTDRAILLPSVSRFDGKLGSATIGLAETMREAWLDSIID